MVTLAIKYRPRDWDSVIEQKEIITILQNQIANNTILNAYLFCGPAGTGKTTTARIFANEINKGQGSIIELDAASYNSVDNVREMAQQAKTKSLDSEYRVFLLDEVHAFSSSAWQAMLKLLEEPPAKSIFLMCTTNPEKIPKTILSRVQRFDLHRISQRGIAHRLANIIDSENKEIMENCGDQDSATDFEWAIAVGLPVVQCGEGAIEYIAKVADGGMRDAITMLDKCLAYSRELTLENVVKALGLADYDIMFKLSNAMVDKDADSVISVIEQMYADGKDLKTFVKTYMNFLLDLCKFDLTRSYDYVQIPSFYELENKQLLLANSGHLLDIIVKLNEQLRWDTTVKNTIEATLLLECFGGK